MKRVVTLSAVLVLGGLGLATAQAGHGSGSSHSSQHSSNKQNNSSSSNSSKLKVYMGGSSSGPKGTPENPNKKDHCDHCDHNGCHDPKFPTIDPGKGDGKGNTGVIVDPIGPWAPKGPTTMNRDGFVWAGDHWERAKAGQNYTVDPNLGGPVVRDHRDLTTNTNNFGGTVRDHRTLTGTTTGGGVTVTNTSNFGDNVRDHRGSNGSNSGIPTLSGPGPLDMLENGLSALGGLFSTTVGDSGRPQVVDHRTSDTSNFGTNVRDHRTTDTSNFSAGGRGGK